TPWLSPKERQSLWKASRELSQRLHQETVGKDYVEGPKSRLTDGPPDFNSENAIERERGRAQARAKFAIILLRMAGRPDADRLQKALKGLAPGPNKEQAQAWYLFCRDLRKALNLESRQELGFADEPK